MQDYVCLLDADFGPLRIKFCSYFPSAVKACLKRHEWVKPPLAPERMADAWGSAHWKSPKVVPLLPEGAALKPLSAPGSQITGLAAASGRLMHFQAI